MNTITKAYLAERRSVAQQYREGAERYRRMAEHYDQKARLIESWIDSSSAASSSPVVPVYSRANRRIR